MKMKKIVAIASAAAVFASMAIPFAAYAGSNTGVEANAIVAYAESNSVTSFVVNEDTPVAAGTTYVDDDNLTVKSVYGTTLGGLITTINGKSFTHSMNVRIDKINQSDALYTEKSGSTPLMFTVKKSGDVTIYYRRQADNGGSGVFTVNDGKDMKFAKVVDGKYKDLEGGVWVESEQVSNGGYAIGTKTLSLEAGVEYMLYARGTTGTFLGFEFEPTAEPTAAPTTEPTAAPTAEPTAAPTTEPTIAPTPSTIITPSTYDTAEGNPAVAYTGIVAPNGNTVTKLTWSATVGSKTVKAEPINVTVNGGIEIKCGLIVNLESDEAKAAGADGISASLEVE